jgi:hypothetical protein
MAYIPKELIQPAVQSLKPRFVYLTASTSAQDLTGFGIMLLVSIKQLRIFT